MALQDADFSWTAIERRRPATRAKYMDLVAEYFAYVALIGFASAVAILAIIFSANVAVTWLDHVASPSFFKQPAEANTRIDENVRQQHMHGAAFAKLPASAAMNIATK